MTQSIGSTQRKAQRVARIGQLAALTLIALIRGEPCTFHTELPVDLVARRSSSPAGTVGAELHATPSNQGGR